MWAKSKSTSAFTIVELLIVIVVIAILAAITIVAYNGIQDRARASAAAQGLSNAAKKIKYWQAEQDSTSFPDCTAFSTALGVSPASCTPTVGSVAYQYTQNLNGTYCITATVSGKSYKLAGNATQSVQGACDGHGLDGITAITNFNINPSLEANGNSWGGWAGSGGVYTLARQTTGGYHGAAFHRATWTTAGSGGVNFTFPAVAGTTYTTSMYVRPSKTTSVWCNWQNGGSTSTSYNITANIWNRVTCTGTVPSGQTSVQFNVYGFNAAVNETLDGDAGMVVEGTQNYNYADGSTAGWVWNNTQYSSTSTGPPQ